MGNNYWGNNETIIASYKEKKELLEYEVDMFRETCKRLPNLKPKFEQNLLLESLATHARILIDFFYGKKKYPNDLIAQDLLLQNLEWGKIRPAESELLEETKNKADKQLAHLSLWRIKLERDGKKKWLFTKISEDIENIIKKFEEEKNRQF